MFIAFAPTRCCQTSFTKRANLVTRHIRAGTIGAAFPAPTVTRRDSFSVMGAIWHVMELPKQGKMAAFTNASAARRDLSLAPLKPLRANGSLWNPMSVHQMRHIEGKICRKPARQLTWRFRRYLIQRASRGNVRILRQILCRDPACARPRQGGLV
jgi:hypothetical protein